MLQIAVIGGIGYIAFARGMISESSLLVLSRLVIEISFPCYAFTHIIKNLEIENLFSLIWLPIASIALLGISYLISLAYLKIDSKVQEKSEFALLATFQNAVYIPIPIISSLFEGTAQSRMFMYLFIFNIPFSALMFTVATHVFRHSKGYPFSWRALFSNPVIAVLVGLASVYTGIHTHIPLTIKSSMEMMGKITVPLVMFVIGSTIYLNYQSKIRACIKTILKVSAIKLIAVPVIVLAVIKLLPISHEFAFLFLLEACMPAASTLSLIARKEEADYKLVGAVILWSYLFSLITVPLFITLYFALR